MMAAVITNKSSVADVAAHVASAFTGDVSRIFLEHEVDGRAFLMLGDEDVARMFPDKKGTYVGVLSWIAKQRSTQEESAVSSTTEEGELLLLDNPDLPNISLPQFSPYVRHLLDTKVVHLKYNIFMDQCAHHLINNIQDPGMEDMSVYEFARLMLVVYGSQIVYPEKTNQHADVFKQKLQKRMECIRVEERTGKQAGDRRSSLPSPTVSTAVILTPDGDKGRQRLTSATIVNADVALATGNAVNLANGKPLHKRPLAANTDISLYASMKVPDSASESETDNKNKCRETDPIIPSQPSQELIDNPKKTPLSSPKPNVGNLASVNKTPRKKTKKSPEKKITEKFLSLKEAQNLALAQFHSEESEMADEQAEKTDSMNSKKSETDDSPNNSPSKVPSLRMLKRLETLSNSAVETNLSGLTRSSPSLRARKSLANNPNSSLENTPKSAKNQPISPVSQTNTPIAPEKKAVLNTPSPPKNPSSEDSVKLLNGNVTTEVVLVQPNDIPGHSVKKNARMSSPTFKGCNPSPKVTPGSRGKQLQFSTGVLQPKVDVKVKQRAPRTSPPTSSSANPQESSNRVVVPRRRTKSNVLPDKLQQKVRTLRDRRSLGGKIDSSPNTARKDWDRSKNTFRKCPGCGRHCHIKNLNCTCGQVMRIPVDKAQGKKRRSAGQAGEKEVKKKTPIRMKEEMKQRRERRISEGGMKERRASEGGMKGRRGSSESETKLGPDPFHVFIQLEEIAKEVDNSEDLDVVLVIARTTRTGRKVQMTGGGANGRRVGADKDVLLVMQQALHKRLPYPVNDSFDSLEELPDPESGFDVPQLTSALQTTLPKTFAVAQPKTAIEIKKEMRSVANAPTAPLDLSTKTSPLAKPSTSALDIAYTEEPKVKSQKVVYKPVLSPVKKRPVDPLTSPRGRKSPVKDKKSPLKSPGARKTRRSSQAKSSTPVLASKTERKSASTPKNTPSNKSAKNTPTKKGNPSFTAKNTPTSIKNTSTSAKNTPAVKKTPTISKNTHITPQIAPNNSKNTPHQSKNAPNQSKNTNVSKITIKITNKNAKNTPTTVKDVQLNSAKAKVQSSKVVARRSYPERKFAEKRKRSETGGEEMEEDEMPPLTKRQIKRPARLESDIWFSETEDTENVDEDNPQVKPEKDSLVNLLPFYSIEDIYTVERILGRRTTEAGAMEYLVRWEGYTPEWDTWEPEDNIIDRSVINDYERNKERYNNDVEMHNIAQ